MGGGMLLQGKTRKNTKSKEWKRGIVWEKTEFTKTIRTGKDKME